jgi:hypothetical protein
MRVRLRDLYSALAGLLPVLLGLGLIYQYAMGEVAAPAALLIVCGAGLLIAAVVRLARERDERTFAARKRDE